MDANEGDNMHMPTMSGVIVFSVEYSFTDHCAGCDNYMHPHDEYVNDGDTKVHYPICPERV